MFVIVVISESMDVHVHGLFHSEEDAIAYAHDNAFNGWTIQPLTPVEE